MGVKVLGCDLSLNHGAVVELDDGELSWFAYYTDIKGSADRCSDGTRLVVPSGVKDRQQRQMMRLAQLEHWLDKSVLIPHPPDYAGVEDYALDARHGSHHMGELGGIARILLWFRSIPFRLMDPISIKMFATHDGTAQKDLVEEAVRERWGQDFSQWNLPSSKNRQTSEDLADAMAVAQLVWLEYQLRTGLIALTDLPHPKELQVFNRVTKSYPISLLARDWLHNPRGDAKPHGGLRVRVEAKIKELEAGGADRAAAMMKELLGDG